MTRKEIKELSEKWKRARLVPILPLRPIVSCEKILEIMLEQDKVQNNDKSNLGA